MTKLYIEFGDTFKTVVSCHICQETIVKSNSYEYKIRSKVIVAKEGDVFAICKGCGHEVKIPLALNLEPELVLDK